MNLLDLQDWLLSDGISVEVDKITSMMVCTEIDNLTPVADAVHTVDWGKLLLAGSFLARSAERRHQEASLRIATAALTLESSQSVRDSAAILLDQLANHRAVSLAENRECLKPGLVSRLGLATRLEAQRRKIENAVLVESTGQWLPVNDFQRRFWVSATGDHSWLSASAPTASGKTFLVLHWLRDRMLVGNVQVAVYLAPTRALVTEIESQLKGLLKDSGDIDVTTLPLREKHDLAASGGRKLIFVFTQERLHLLLNLLNDAAKVGLLVVDEAHKVGDHQRGMILQDAVERVLRINPDMKIVFISPATQNPGDLLDDAPSGASKMSLDSDAPTVLQNLIVAQQVPGKPKQWMLGLRSRDLINTIGTLHLANKPAGLKKRLAFIAAAAGARGGTLIYANGAAEAEDVAFLVSQIVPHEGKIDPELVALADLARKGVHPTYQLAPLVERGVAFHYGNMPSLIRMEIERLFREGKIRFLVCTSTLIEGVNLSCRTIVVRGPRKGKGKPMEPHDFWNLAGRAGRWGNEFQGNIICIDPFDAEAWPKGVPARARYPIKREIDAVLGQSEELITYLSARKNTSPRDLKDSDQFESVGAYLLSTYMRRGAIQGADLAKRHNASDLEKLDMVLSELAKEIDLTSETVARHPGVSAVGLQKLLKTFRNYEADIENLLPVPTESIDSYDRFKAIMERINTDVFPAFPDALIPLHALVVMEWLKGLSLAEIIKRRIRYQEGRGRKYKLPELIRTTMEMVEQIARFKAPKYFSAYIDILKIFLREKGREDLIGNDIDIGTALEFGVSSQTLLSLMELGLSRMSAVALYEKIARDDLDKDGCVAWVIEHQSQFAGIDLPALILREVFEKLVSPIAADKSLE